MRLNNYIKKLQLLQEEYGNKQLCYGIDDEGNKFRLVFFEPTPGQFSPDDGIFENDTDVVNAICIN